MISKGFSEVNNRSIFFYKGSISTQNIFFWKRHLLSQKFFVVVFQRSASIYQNQNYRLTQSIAFYPSFLFPNSMYLQGKHKAFKKSGWDRRSPGISFLLPTNHSYCIQACQIPCNPILAPAIPEHYYWEHCQWQDQNFCKSCNISSCSSLYNRKHNLKCKLFPKIFSFTSDCPLDLQESWSF